MECVYDKDRQILTAEQKALEINLDDKIYGTFAEIGAGQEVARNFFKVGAAAGTIAKTMSAYDKTYSDAIYGIEDSKRYVCESRVYKMLDHEYGLMEERLQNERPYTRFFVFADSVAAINYSKTIKGNGWLGVRFQITPDGKPNDLVLHVKLLDQDNIQQQEAIGELGVNLIYACYYYNFDMELFVSSLIDGLRGRINIDMIRLTGADFSQVDNRLLSYYLVKYGLTDVAIFDSKKNSVHASEGLYKKALMVVRGNFRPPTKVTMDVFKSSFDQFRADTDLPDGKCHILSELTMENLAKSGSMGDEDFLSRADALCSIGQSVIVSNCSNHQNLINYLSDYKIQKLGLVIGARELLEIIVDKYENNHDGRLLVAFGELFTRNIKIYVYPALHLDSGELMTARNLPVPEGIKFLYKHLIDSEQIVEVNNYNLELLNIYPHNVLEMIKTGKLGWEEALPEEIVNQVKSKGLFGYKGVDAAVEFSS